MCNIYIEDKEEFKKEVKKLLSSVIAKPNKDVLEITFSYDPNLDSITLKYSSLSKDSDVLVFDEITKV